MRKRNNVIYVRLNDEEYETLLKGVKSSGLTIQAYIIQSVLGSHVTSSEEIAELKEQSNILKDIDKQLRGIGININQLAYKANGMGVIPSVAVLESLIGEIQIIKREVNEAWQSTRQSISGQCHTQPCETA